MTRRQEMIVAEIHRLLPDHAQLAYVCGSLWKQEELMRGKVGGSTVKEAATSADEVFVEYRDRIVDLLDELSSLSQHIVWVVSPP